MKEMLVDKGDSIRMYFLHSHSSDSSPAFSSRETDQRGNSTTEKPRKVRNSNTSTFYRIPPISPANISVASPVHSTLPLTSLISPSVSPNLTIPHRIILGSIATVLYTKRCVAGEASKRMMKWCPESCRI